ncbi:MAG: hypothetical protein KDD89_08600 [Anaerolineales bacterium]|nr:hypothetical protein [Anaerolineales bacterium]
MIVIVNASGFSPSKADLERIEGIMHAESWQQIALGSVDAKYVRFRQEEFGCRLHVAIIKVIAEMKKDEMSALLAEAIKGKR